MAGAGPAPFAYDIPAFNLSGVLPPFLGMTPAANSPLMSPYPTSLVKIVERFGRSPVRVAILRGFIAYRRALATVGLTDGFQWLAESFLEDIEALERRHPRDVDVITFCRRPASYRAHQAWESFAKQHFELFWPTNTKATYRCDSNFVDLDTPSDNIVSQTRYWLALFSDRRSGVWKGMLQVPLGLSQDDDDALALLNGGLQ
jgi:hypothetical protein